MDGKVINVQEVQALATLPGKEELFAKLLFLINAPAQRFVTVMGATGRDLAVVVNQGVEKEKFVKGAPAYVEVPVVAAPEAAASPTPEANAPEVSAPEVEPEKQAEAAAGEAPVEGESV